MLIVATAIFYGQALAQESAKTKTLVVIGSAALFIIASAALTFATSLELLSIARFVQGVSIAAGPILGRAIIRDAVEANFVIRSKHIPDSKLATVRGARKQVHVRVEGEVVDRILAGPDPTQAFATGIAHVDAVVHGHGNQGTVAVELDRLGNELAAPFL